jgi:hypothetical protein
VATTTVLEKTNKRRDKMTKKVNKCSALLMQEEQEIDRDELQLALETILRDKDNPALNYAINYTRVAWQMVTYGEGDLHCQLLYVLGNISTWRGPGHKEARTAIKTALKQLKKYKEN